MQDYYRRRAQEYEEIYRRQDPKRQQELMLIAGAMKEKMRGLKILEVACGTGYWTQFVSETANQVTATDAVSEVIEMAKLKSYKCPATFEVQDAYNLKYPNQQFEGAVANFWLSHVPKESISKFLTGLHRVLKPGAAVFMTDNMNIPGVGGELILRKNDANTYKKRKLRNGEESVVLKNYYGKDELRQIFLKHSSDEPEIRIGECFWHASYNVGLK